MGEPLTPEVERKRGTNISRSCGKRASSPFGNGAQLVSDPHDPHYSLIRGRRRRARTRTFCADLTRVRASERPVMTNS